MTVSVFTALPAAIRTRFSTLIELGGDGGAAIPTRYPNDNRAEPDSGTWARLTIREGERRQADVGTALIRSRTVGVVYVELYGQVGTGTKALTDLAGRIATSFQRVTAAGVTYETPAFKGSGGSSGESDGTWRRVVLAIPFYFDDTDA